MRVRHSLEVRGKGNHRGWKGQQIKKRAMSLQLTLLPSGSNLQLAVSDVMSLVYTVYAFVLLPTDVG